MNEFRAACERYLAQMEMSGAVKEYARKRVNDYFDGLKSVTKYASWSINRDTGHIQYWVGTNGPYTLAEANEVLSMSYWGNCAMCGGPLDCNTSCPACSNGGNTCTNVDPPEVVIPAPEPPFDGCCNKPWTWGEYKKRYWCTECGNIKPEDKDDE